MEVFRYRLSARWRDRRGFTLPEVLITIALLGILVAIAVPTWWSVVEGRQVDSATTQFASDLRLAHTRAANQLNNWEVRYTIGSSTYQLVPDGGTAITRTLPDNAVVFSSEISDGSGNAVIKFTPDGSAAAEPAATFSDADVDGEMDLEISKDGNPESNVAIIQSTSRVKLVG